MHVDRVRSSHTTRSGETRCYESVLLRRSVRDGAKVRKQTLANLSALPPAAVDAIEAVLNLDDSGVGRGWLLNVRCRFSAGMGCSCGCGG
jgi:hypothetical protein